MTKQFTYILTSKYIGSFFLNGTPLTIKELCDKLNEQDQRITELEEENQKLRELLFDPRRITNEVQSG